MVVASRKQPAALQAMNLRTLGQAANVSPKQPFSADVGLEALPQARHASILVHFLHLDKHSTKQLTAARGNSWTNMSREETRRSRKIDTLTLELRPDKHTEIGHTT